MAPGLDGPLDPHQVVEALGAEEVAEVDADLLDEPVGVAANPAQGVMEGGGALLRRRGLAVHEALLVQERGAVHEAVREPDVLEGGALDEHGIAGQEDVARRPREDHGEPRRQDHRGRLPRERPRAQERPDGDDGQEPGGHRAREGGEPE